MCLAGRFKSLISSMAGYFVYASSQSSALTAVQTLVHLLVNNDTGKRRIVVVVVVSSYTSKRRRVRHARNAKYSARDQTEQICFGRLSKDSGRTNIQRKLTRVGLGRLEEKERKREKTRNENWLKEFIGKTYGKRLFNGVDLIVVSIITIIIKLKLTDSNTILARAENFYIDSKCW